jgi:hypothetical protein
MTVPSQPLRKWPIGLLVLLVVACVPYVLMLMSAATPLSSGDAAMGDAIATLFLTVALWVVLAIMLVVGGVTGAMPRWAALLAVVLVPMSGVAAFVAIDMCSRHMPGAIVFDILLPLLIAFYAFWAGMPQLHARLPPDRTSTAVWAAIFFLSIATFVLGS